MSDTRQRILSPGSIKLSRDAEQRCAEIQETDVHRCPVDDLCIVLQDGTKQPLNSDQKQCILNFRGKVPDGVSGFSQTTRLVNQNKTKHNNTKKEQIL